MEKQLGKWGQTLSRHLSFTKYYLKKHLNEFAQVIGPTSLILDIGSGRLTPYRTLFESKRHIGLDYFENADIRADAKYLPFTSDSTGVVLATEVFEHLAEPVQTLAEINRVLCQEGYLILTVPLIWGVHDYVDYQRWTQRGLKKILNETGFEVVQLKYRGGIFSTIGCMITQIPMQLFGEMEQQRHWWAAGVYMILWAMSVPIPWLASLLDPLDRRRDFTLGYSALCRKK